MKAAKEPLEVNLAELEALAERVRAALGEEDYQKLKKGLRALSYLTELIGGRDTTISQLRALLVKPSTEKTRKVLEQAGVEAERKSHPPPSSSGSESGREKPKPGHGRNGAEGYKGARRIKVSHGLLKPGGSLSGVPEGESLRAQGTGPAHSGGRPSIAPGYGLRTGEPSL